ncbi:MAG: hypothetical protein CVV25_01270 [Ignavibacteriae bacterium HGW-Ignavibacteriae-4]|jgi:hypothetical protein|nr:MAG: hypothetical protein CVV25_01270 [Ignavibacteriae bacterium HGW-Ignavibacteriae-4]
MDISKNGFLKDIIKHLKVVSNDSPDYFINELNKSKIPLEIFNEKNFLINWDEVTPSYKFFFDYVGCEDEISDLLSKSHLFNENTVIIAISNDKPIIEVETKIFINHWYSFFAASGYVGVVVMGKSKKFFLEMVDRDFNFYSNFPVKESKK